MAETTTVGPIEQGIASYIIGEHVFTKSMLAFARQQDATLKALVEVLEAMLWLDCETAHTECNIHAHADARAALKLAKGGA